MRVEIQDRETVGSPEDIYTTATVPAKAGNNVVAPAIVASTRLRIDAKPFLKSLGNAVQPGGESVISFFIRVNGAKLYPYDGSNNTWGDPQNPSELPARIQLPRGALFEIMATSTDAANSWRATGRAFIEYEDF